MNAPTLVLLAAGSSDLQVNQVAHAMRVGLQEMRPELTIHAAFLDHCPPSGPQVMSRLARSGVREVAFVPLLLSSPYRVDERVATLAERTRSAHPQIRSAIAAPIGPEAALLARVDIRLREALRNSHTAELDGLVLLADGTPDSRGLALLNRRARQWGQHHRLPVVPVFANGAAAGVTNAVRTLRAEGRRHIAIGSLCLSQDATWSSAADQAKRAGAVAISQPLGADRAILDLVLARYAVAAMDLIDFGFDDTEHQDTGIHESGAAPALRVVSA